MLDLEKRVRVVRCGREAAAVVDWKTGAPLMYGHREHVGAILYDAGYQRMKHGHTWIKTRRNRWRDREARP